MWSGEKQCPSSEWVLRKDGKCQHIPSTTYSQSVLRHLVFWMYNGVEKQP